MKVCIVGGGKVGFYLSKTLMEHGHDPVIIEKDERACARLADQLDSPVVHGDGTRVEILRLARVEDCRAVVGVTGRDEVNLTVCQMAKRLFAVKKTVARVNNPRNALVLRQLGVDIAVSATDAIAMMIEREVAQEAIHQLMSIAGGDAALTELLLPEGFKYAGRSLAQLQIPPDVVIVFLTRGQELIIPRGNTVLQPGDKVVCVARNKAFHDLAKSWGLAER